MDAKIYPNSFQSQPNQSKHIDLDLLLSTLAQRNLQEKDWLHLISNICQHQSKISCNDILKWVEEGSSPLSSTTIIENVSVPSQTPLSKLPFKEFMHELTYQSIWKNRYQEALGATIFGKYWSFLFMRWCFWVFMGSGGLLTWVATLFFIFPTKCGPLMVCVAFIHFISTIPLLSRRILARLARQFEPWFLFLLLITVNTSWISLYRHTDYWYLGIEGIFALTPFIFADCYIGTARLYLSKMLMPFVFFVILFVIGLVYFEFGDIDATLTWGHSWYAFKVKDMLIDKDLTYLLFLGRYIMKAYLYPQSLVLISRGIHEDSI